MATCLYNEGKIAVIDVLSSLGIPETREMVRRCKAMDKLRVTKKQRAEEYGKNAGKMPRSMMTANMQLGMGSTVVVLFTTPGLTSRWTGACPVCEVPLYQVLSRCTLPVAYAAILFCTPGGSALWPMAFCLCPRLCCNSLGPDALYVPYSFTCATFAVLIKSVAISVSLSTVV